MTTLVATRVVTLGDGAVVTPDGVVADLGCADDGGADGADAAGVVMALVVALMTA